MLKPTDELLLNWAYETTNQPVIPEANVLHDPYGVLSTCLQAEQTSFCSDNVVHHNRLRQALLENYGPEASPPSVHRILTDALPNRSINLMHLPKSLDLFELYLINLTRTAGTAAKLAVAFHTRHFSSRMLEIAERYAANVHQSRAYKKARLLFLEQLSPPATAPQSVHHLEYRDKRYVLNYGVFSAKHIDNATRFLLDTWSEAAPLASLPSPQRLLDIGCGCGILGDQLQLHHYPDAKLAGTDVSHVAVASTRANTSPQNDLHWREDLAVWPDGTFPLIVTNPPFHDGHRNEIGPTLQLFREAAKKLTVGGHLVIVANRHLNYVTHLRKLFEEVIIVAENRKYVIYRCSGSD